MIYFLIIYKYKYIIQKVRMVDATQRKLQVPARFIPFMEAHRLHELFHDLVQELVINQPDDHISFMKKTLGRIMHYRDRPRVVLIAPPEIDKQKLGELICNSNGAVCVTAKEIHVAYQQVNKDDEEHQPIMDHATFAEETKKFLHGHQFLQNGWIFIDFPNTLDEATALVRAGVLPTHTFHLTLKPIREHKVIDYFSTCKKEEDPVLIAEQEIKKNYQRNLLDLLEVYYQSLNLIEADGRTLEDIAISCSQLMTVRNLFSRPPMLPRILLLGPFGSGRKTQALLLCQRFNLVHVDLAEMLAQTRQEQSPIADQLRQKEINGNELSSKFLLTIVERRLKAHDCTNQGWVMTGYPRHVDDFRHFDQTARSPNRVMFLNVSLCECMVRLSGRRFNMYTGTEYHLSRNPPYKSEMKDLKMQPQDDPKQVIADHNANLIKLQEMKNYAGGSGLQFDGTMSVTKIHELICDTIMKPPTCVGPRDGILEINSD